MSGRPSRPTNQLIISSAHTFYLSEKSRKKNDGHHNIALWSTAHARPAPPPSIFYLDLAILFFVIIPSVSSTERGPRCTRKRHCRPHARGYVRTKQSQSALAPFGARH